MPTLDSTAQASLGSGLRFPIRTNQGGGLAVSRYEDKVKESVWAILSTSKGERVMRPEFGCDIHEFVFATLDSTNLTLIRSAVREALVLWEPRIDVHAVEVRPDPDRAERLRISVNYTIRVTNAVTNLVFPFYLQTGG
jgi:uncharacterized protein